MVCRCSLLKLTGDIRVVAVSSDLAEIVTSSHLDVTSNTPITAPTVSHLKVRLVTIITISIVTIVTIATFPQLKAKAGSGTFTGRILNHQKVNSPNT